MKSEHSTTDFKRWRKTQHKQKQWSWCVIIINESKKTSFWKYYHGKQTQINEGYYDISRDEVGTTGFFDN